MNERIRRLAEQALKHSDTDNDGLTVFDNDELEKFAELIVRECASIAHGSDMPSKDIKEYFGIKS